MSVERDTDRTLRAWISTGVDRAPERFVWAALDEIERTPQRPAWRTTLEHVGARTRPASAVLGVAAAVLVAAAVIFRVALPDGDIGSTRPFVLADLDGIAVWEDTKPPTWRLDNLVSNPHEILTIPIRTMTAAELDALKEPPGYIGGRYTDFSGPAGAFMSWTTVFGTADEAEAAFPLIANELSSLQGWGYGPGEPIDMGNGGVFYSGTTTSLTGPPGTNEPIPSQVYLWRNANVLLSVGGWFEFDEAELRSVAEAMDARADAIARSKP